MRVHRLEQFESAFDFLDFVECRGAFVFLNLLGAKVFAELFASEHFAAEASEETDELLEVSAVISEVGAPLGPIEFEESLEHIL